MKTIALNEAIKILEDASAVIWDVGENKFLTYPSVDSEDTDEADHEFLYLNCTDDRGYEYYVNFTDRQNKEVNVDGSSMFLIDSEGEKNQITILCPRNLG